MTDYLKKNVYIIWFLTCLSSTWWYHFFIENIVFKNFIYITSYFIYYLRPKWISEISIIYSIIVRKFAFRVSLVSSGVLDSDMQFNNLWLYVECHLVCVGILLYVITFSWWCVGTWSWLTSFVLVLFRSTKRWSSSSRPDIMVIHGVTNYYMVFLTIWKAG